MLVWRCSGYRLAAYWEVGTVKGDVEVWGKGDEIEKCNSFVVIEKGILYLGRPAL